MSSTPQQPRIRSRVEQTMRMPRYQSFDVFLHGRYTATVFFEEGYTTEEVRQSLINRDGLPSTITVHRSVRR